MEYWTVSFGIANRNGYTCRECKKPIMKFERIAVRDGRKIRLMYHEKCFSGESDPRTQKNSSAHDIRLKNSISASAPKEKGYGKWSTSYYGYNPTFPFDTSVKTIPIKKEVKKSSKKNK